MDIRKHFGNWNIFLKFVKNLEIWGEKIGNLETFWKFEKCFGNLEKIWRVGKKLEICKKDKILGGNWKFGKRLEI